MPNVDDFRAELSGQLQSASRAAKPYVDINAGQLHRELGGYPGTNHQMPTCCNVMYESQRPGDAIMSRPPKGKGATLTIRYKLPRH